MATAENPLEKAHVAMSVKKLLGVDKDRTCDRLVTQMVAECGDIMEQWLGDNRGN